MTSMIAALQAYGNWWQGQKRLVRESDISATILKEK
jgi:hypothetical protein